MRGDIVGSRGWWIMLLAGWVMFGGCTLLPPGEREPVRTFMLVGVESAESLDSAPVAGSALRQPATVIVGVPQARPGFDTARMIYVPRDYELRFFALHQWADTPARMLHPLIIHALDRLRVWRVVPPSSPVQGDFRLDVRQVLLQQEFGQQPSRVRFQAQAQLIDLHAQRLRGAREFMVVEDAPSDDPYGGVIAANRAVEVFLRQLRDWLPACMLDSPGEAC